MKFSTKKHFIIYTIYTTIILVLLLITTNVYSKQKTREELMDYYENFNLTEELEKKYNETGEEHDEEYYKNIENLDKRKTKRDKIKQREEEENRLWEEKIHAFSPHNLLTIVLSPGEYEIFYEEIKIVPTNITIAFYVHDETSKIDFEVYNPKNKGIHRSRGKNKAFFEFLATQPGIYEIHVDNQRVCMINNLLI
jgi:hypothetical protein